MCSKANILIEGRNTIFQYSIVILRFGNFMIKIILPAYEKSTGKSKHHLHLSYFCHENALMDFSFWFRFRGHDIQMLLLRLLNNSKYLKSSSHKVLLNIIKNPNHDKLKVLWVVFMLFAVLRKYRALFSTLLLRK